MYTLSALILSHIYLFIYLFVYFYAQQMEKKYQFFSTDIERRNNNNKKAIIIKEKQQTKQAVNKKETISTCRSSSFLSGCEIKLET